MPLKNPHIVFLDAGSVDLGDINLSSIKKQGSYKAHENSTPTQMLRRAREADIIITNKNVIRQDLLEKLPRLKLICVAATGVNNIDLEATRKKGIAVTNVAGYSTTTVAEHALLFMLALSHRLQPHHEASVKGKWSQSSHFALFDYPFCDLNGKILGLIGYGKIGHEVARLTKAFGMQVMIAKLPGRRYSKKEKRVALNQVLQKADFISLHCPLSPLTEHLIDKKRINLMKRSAFVLNLARGPIVHEAHMAQALRANRIAGYATDVFSHEPPPKNHPLLQKAVSGKVLITPHVAWASRESRQRLVDEIALNVEAFKKGKKRNRIV